MSVFLNSGNVMEKADQPTKPRNGQTRTSFMDGAGGVKGNLADSYPWCCQLIERPLVHLPVRVLAWGEPGGSGAEHGLTMVSRVVP